MQLWSSQNGNQWKHWDSPMAGLHEFTAAAPASVVIALDDPSELGGAQALIHLARKVASAPVDVTMCIRRPTASAFRSARQAGADHVLLNTDDRGGDDPPLSNAVEIGKGICPALHLRSGKTRHFSVCGRHDDRMVLTKRHLRRWCLAGNETCPHWLGETNA